MRTLKPYLWTLGLLWVLPILAVVVGYLVLDHNVPPDSCEGIGFGCELSPADTMVLWAMIVGVPVLGTAGLVGIVTVAVVQGLRRRRERGVDGSSQPQPDPHYMT